MNNSNYFNYDIEPLEDKYNESIGFLEEELENTQCQYNKFYFAKGILDNKSNAEDYELVYTKC